MNNNYYGNYGYPYSSYQTPYYNNVPNNNYMSKGMSNVNQQNAYFGNTKEFDYVNGVEEAKNYILSPNQLVYLKDKQSNLIFEKKADEQGRYVLKAYELKEVNQSKDNDYVTKSDFTALEEKINKLAALLENKKDLSEEGKQ